MDDECLGDVAMARSRLHHWVSSLLVLSLAIGGIAAWRALRATGEAPLPTAEPQPARLESTTPREDADVKLPDDPKTVVLALWSGFVADPINQRQLTRCEIRADGSGFWQDFGFSAKSFSLTAPELQSLLRFIVREKRFFDMAKDHVHLDPKTAATRGPYHVDVLHVRADGRQHEVKYLLEAPPATPEVEDLKAILARLETVKASARAARDKSAGRLQAIRVPRDPDAAVIRHGRADADFHRVIYADGSVKVEGKDQIGRALSPGQLQELLHYIVRDQKFFDLRAEHVYFPPGSDPATDRAEIKTLRIQADGKQHTVKYDGLEHAPPSAEVERLKRIIARIEREWHLARPKAADENSR